MNHVERHVAALALDLGALVRKMARMRDKGDKIVSSMRDFASAEAGSMRKSLEGLGECLSAVENSQQLQVCESICILYMVRSLCWHVKCFLQKICTLARKHSLIISVCVCV